ncbi:MAG: hypothetical protein D6699_07375 [Aquificota bacterium]|nr:MAG: hypothetical protein D6699_07375 [Aquificota bacterium]
MSVRKRELNLLSLLLVFFALAFLLEHYYSLREAYYKEYLQYKEVMLLLKNYQTKKKPTLDENYIRGKLSQVGAELVSFRQTDTGYQVKGKNLHGSKIPLLTYELEKDNVQIVKFLATDNTGQGLYDFELVLR